MAITVPSFTHKHRFWFYFRKCIFQVFFPILLALMSYWDFVSQTDRFAYHHLYFYTSFILFSYAGIRYVLDFIFSMSSDDVIFKKEINLDQTTPNLLLTCNMTNFSNEHNIIITKKIFKLRYSKSIFFRSIDKICWYLGIDSPLLIPFEIIAKLGSTKNELTSDNEEAMLYTTLTNLSVYSPKKYNTANISEDVMHGHLMDKPNSYHENLLPQIVISPLDLMITEMQKELFNRQSEIDRSNV